MVVASCQARGVQVADECEVETVSRKETSGLQPSGLGRKVRLDCGEGSKPAVLAEPETPDLSPPGLHMPAPASRVVNLGSRVSPREPAARLIRWTAVSRIPSGAELARASSGNLGVPRHHDRWALDP